jgi:hypothetical protein
MIPPPRERDGLLDLRRPCTLRHLS